MPELTERIAQGIELLDVGCGSGRTLVSNTIGASSQSYASATLITGSLPSSNAGGSPLHPRSSSPVAHGKSVLPSMTTLLRAGSWVRVLGHAQIVEDAADIAGQLSRISLQVVRFCNNM